MAPNSSGPAGSTVHVRSVDVAGNISPAASVPLKVDTVAPTLTPRPAGGTVFAKNEWKNSVAKACSPVGGNPGSSRLCVTVTDAASGPDGSSAVIYTLVRTDAAGQVEACWNGSGFVTNAACTPTHVAMTRTADQFASAPIAQDLMGPTNNQQYHYRWTVAGVRDLAGNSAPAAIFTFQLTG